MRHVVPLLLLAACASEHGATGDPDLGATARDMTAGAVDLIMPSPTGTPPVLTPGVWTAITPPVDMSDTYGLAWFEIDPSNPNILYACIDERGLWKTTDRGTSWKKVGNLDSPIAVRVDPRNGQRLLATQGVRGATLGFWISEDGGDSFHPSPGFESMSPTHDVTTLAVDPSNFDHFLVGSHSAWEGYPNGGILESKDGGETFIAHPPVPEFSTGSMGLAFLYNPALGIGNSDTWLVATDGEGLWRTADGGAHFTRVTPKLDKDGKELYPNFSITHGGTQLYYTSTGVLYAGLFVYPARSMDNGVTWEMLDGLPYAHYYSVYGDGKTLYTQISFTGDNAGRGPQPYLTSLESDGTTWKPYDPSGKGPQTFDNGPFRMLFEASNGILYSSNWRAGLLALKVVK